MDVQEAVIRREGNDGPIVSASLLGVNSEMIKDTHAGFISDRLDNPKFCGPAHELTGIAPGWHPITHNMGGMHCKLVAGMSLSGGESQMVHVYGGKSGRGLVQKGIGLKAGETLEVEIWAKVRHYPVTIEVSMGSKVRSNVYDKAELTIDAAYWKRYTAQLQAPMEDREAIFMITFVTDGQVLFDQVHMRPAGETHLSSDMLALLKDLQLPNIRFPGGSMTANYYWQHGTGPIHLRPSIPDACFKWRIDYEFGIEEYLQLCIDQQIQPFITINIGGATPEQIGKQAAYCADFYRKRDLEPPEIYFMIGNESYGVWEPAHMTGSMYVDVLHAFVPVVRANYPNPRIVVMGAIESTGVHGPNTPLRQEVLKHAHLFDVLSLQHYGGGWAEDPEEWAALIAKQPGAVHVKLQQLVDDCREAGVSATIGLTEWGLRNEAMHWDEKKFFEPDDAAHGMFFAGVLHVLARHSPHVEVANFFNLINAMGLVRNDGGFVSGTGVSDIYQLYRPAFPGNFIPLSLHSPTFENGEDWLDALALRTDQSHYMFVCNRSALNELKVKFAGVAQIESIVMMQAASMEDRFQEVSICASRHNELALPPLSIVRLQWH